VSYVSPIDALVIDDSNADEQVHGVKVDGQPAIFGWAPPPLGDQSQFCSPFDIPLVDRSEWDERIRDMEKYRSTCTSFAKAMGLSVKDQKRTNYCWAFSAVQCIEVTRAVQGLEYVALSPASVAAPVTRYQNPRGNPAGVGGWATRFVDYAAQHGVCPSDVWEEHTISQSLDNATTQAARKLYVPTEWWTLPTGNFDAVMTSLFAVIPVAIGLSWWGHQVTAMDPVKMDGNGNYGVRIWNPWGPNWPKAGAGGIAILTESKARPSDASAVRVITQR
jgi:hypothetical protein